MGGRRFELRRRRAAFALRRAGASIARQNEIKKAKGKRRKEKGERTPNPWNICVFLCWFLFKAAGRVAGAAGGWRRPHKYTYSTYNTRIERFWNEVNARVLLYFRLLLEEKFRPKVR